MKVEEIKKIAQKLGIQPSGPKAELIRSIQKKEGNFACFGTATDGFCDQQSCLWMADCLKPARKIQ